MMKNYVILIKLLAGSLIMTPFWIPVIAMTKASNVDEFTVENQRTHLTQNYVVESDLIDGNSDNDNIGQTYAIDSIIPHTSPEVLPGLIVDYANMIRNDIILLDNSVETRTRKRGNVKVEKFNNGLHDIPCNCEQENGEILLLGEDYVPSYIETKRCNTGVCKSPYSCQRRVYNITVLKRKKYGDKSLEELPDDLGKRWVAVKKPITIACFCTADYRERY